MNRTRAIVLLSGGLDSAVALYWALNRGYKVETLTFDYFRRSRREIEACIRISKISGCRNRRFDLGFIKELDDSRKATRNPELKRAPSAYIPSRNLIFYGIASSLAELSDSKYIVGGHNRDDVRSFPDSKLSFFESLNHTASAGKISGDRTGRIIIPLSKLSKSSVIKLGQELGVPFQDTWSCYRSGRKPCGKCSSCILRAKAFLTAGITDPLQVKASS